MLNLFLEFNGQRETLGKTVLYFSNAKSLFAESKSDFPVVWEFRFCVKIHFGLLKSFDFKLVLSLLRGEDTFHHATINH